MAVATCQFSQGALIGDPGVSLFGVSVGVPVVLTDAGGPGATSYLWELVSWPAPLEVPPSIIDANLQIATITPTLDGVYILRLTRTEGAVTTTDYRFFGVPDTDGLTLPSAGQSGHMTNQSASAQAAGWAGRATASTNFQMDAYLRFLKARLGKWVGAVEEVAHESSSPVAVTVTAGTTAQFRSITLTGSGAYTEILAKPATVGFSFRYVVAVAASAGVFSLKNGFGGPTILTLPVPSTGTSVFEAELVYIGTNWVLIRLTSVGFNASTSFQEIPMVSGLKTTSEIIPTRIGTCTLDTTDFPSGTTYTFQAQVEVTSARVARIQVYNLTDGVYLNTYLQSTSETPETLIQSLTLTGGSKTYETHLWMSLAGGPADRVSCSSAKIIAEWG